MSVPFREVARLLRRGFSTISRIKPVRSTAIRHRTQPLALLSIFLQSRHLQQKPYSKDNVPQMDMVGMALLDLNVFEQICSDTLEELCEYFEEIVEKTGKIDTDPDVTYSDGVLTVKLGSKFGTYVINRQTPNRQIWLSSPTSGPKRYDFVANDGKPLPGQVTKGKWIYKHDGQCLHQLLQKEIKLLLADIKIDFVSLQNSGLTSN